MGNVDTVDLSVNMLHKIPNSGRMKNTIEDIASHG